MIKKLKNYFYLITILSALGSFNALADETYQIEPEDDSINGEMLTDNLPLMTEVVEPAMTETIEPEKKEVVKPAMTETIEPEKKEVVKPAKKVKKYKKKLKKTKKTKKKLKKRKSKRKPVK